MSQRFSWLNRFAHCVVLLSLVGLSQQAWAASAQEKLEAEMRGLNTRYILVGPQGGAISDEDFRGRFQLITFGYTFCPDVCPTTLAEMTTVLNALGEQAAKIQPIFITVDPERDTPSVLKTYVQFFDPRIIGLTGNPGTIKRIAQNYKVRYARVKVRGSEDGHYVVDHTAGMFLLGPDGRLIRKFAYGRPVEQLVQDIKAILQQP